LSDQPRREVSIFDRYSDPRYRTNLAATTDLDAAI